LIKKIEKHDVDRVIYDQVTFLNQRWKNIMVFNNQYDI